MIPVYFAQKAFVFDSGRLLVVRRSQADEHHPGKWEVPGGRLDAGEGIDAHLIREVHEEVGIQVAPGAMFYVWSWQITPRTDASPTTVVAIARLCTALTLELSDRGRVADDNLDLAEWIQISDARTLNWIPNMVPVVEEFLKVVHG